MSNVIGKFVRTAVKPGCIMIKVDFNGGEKWVTVPEPVFNIVKTTAQPGQVITMVNLVTTNDGKLHKADNIEVAQSTSAPVVTSPPVQAQTTLPVASTPGSQPVSKVAPVLSYNNGDYMKQRHPADSQAMEKLSVLSSVCGAISAVQGLDANMLGDMIENLYDRFLKKVNING